MASMSKKTNVKLELLIDYDMLLMVEEGIRGGICRSIHRYAKANNKYMNNCDKNKESSYIQYLDPNNLYGWAMSQKLAVNGFKWIKNVTEIDEKFIKNDDEDSDKGYIFEVDVKKKVHRIIEFNQAIPYIDMNTELRKIAKNDFEKDFFKLMNNVVFGKTMGNVRKHRDI